MSRAARTKAIQFEQPDAFAKTLAVGCTRHRAAPDEGCWGIESTPVLTVPGLKPQTLAPRTNRAMCIHRVTAAGVQIETSKQTRR